MPPIAPASSEEEAVLMIACPCLLDGSANWLLTKVSLTFGCPLAVFFLLFAVLGAGSDIFFTGPETSPGIFREDTERENGVPFSSLVPIDSLPNDLSCKIKHQQMLVGV